MRSVTQAVTREHPSFEFTVSKHCYLPGGEIPADHPLVASCLRATERCFGGESRPVEFRAGCELSLLVGAGIPTVILGPGSLDQAHTVDEFLMETQLAGAQALYGELIRSFNRE
jgi:acetylornithine deacetylase/succinyl-diaminopimelate desuccinylase-like protein